MREGKIVGPRERPTSKRPGLWPALSPDRLPPSGSLATPIERPPEFLRLPPVPLSAVPRRAIPIEGGGLEDPPGLIRVIGLAEDYVEERLDGLARGLLADLPVIAPVEEGLEAAPTRTTPAKATDDLVV